MTLIRRDVGEFADHFLCDFSTTGPLERTVSAVVLLDVLQPYFSYLCLTICGIPTVTLEGTVEDWRRLRDKVELLEPFQLGWWLEQLRPICDQFVRAAEGDVDLEHWQRLYKIRQAYGAEVINGWIGKLFPYVTDSVKGSFSRRNPLLDPKVEAKIRKLEQQDTQDENQVRFSAPGIRVEDLPRGMSQVPFVYEGQHGKRAMEFLAGAMVVTQNAETLALRPTLGWAVREAPPIEQALARLVDHHTLPPSAVSYGHCAGSMGTDYLPTDVVRFHLSSDGAVLHDGLYRVLPLAEWREPEWVRSAGAENSFRVGRELFRFAELSDGTELLIRLEGAPSSLGAVSVGRRRDGSSVADTGLVVARSFTEFLLRALDAGRVVYFRSQS